MRRDCATRKVIHSESTQYPRWHAGCTTAGMNQNNSQSAHKQLNDHFATIEAILSDLRAKVEANRMGAVSALREGPLGGEARLARARVMLAATGSITASDVQLDMGVSHSTAMRVIHTLAREKEGIMVLEAAGPTFRVRLWHPDRVILDHVVR